MRLLTEHEVALRLGFFFGILVVMAVWEVVQPRRQLRVVKLLRWRSNLALVLLNSLILRLLFPAAAVGVAAYAGTQGWGLMNVLAVPAFVAILLSFVLLDCVIYWQHVMFHRLPLLWRIHRVHHVDLDYDVTTGLRFHPLEVVLSMLIKFAAIALLGAPVEAVILFEVVLNGAAMFNHGNVSLPPSLDRYLRWVLVTPDMHRVHHSVEPDETNSNYGFCLPWWDRLFRSYRDQPRAGHDAMTIGLNAFREIPQTTSLSGILLLPFGSSRKSSLQRPGDQHE